jgi:molybdenum cofactor biosynthesis enzyme MoaA
MIDKLENTLRIKVTGNCNRNCSFCHEEGGMSGIEDVTFTSELSHIINQISEHLNIDVIALTGGEPIIHRNLLEFTENIASNTLIKKFKLTTNGITKKPYDFWAKISDIGLFKVNISMPDILDLVEIRTKEHITKVLENQIELIRILTSIGIGVDINVVVFNDYLYTMNVISNLLKIKSKDLVFEIVLLPNLISFIEYTKSQDVLKKVKSNMRLKRSSCAYRSGTSNKVECYQSDSGTSVSIKSTRESNNYPYMLDAGCCKNCDYKKNKCQEGFYGLRIEQRDGNCFIRLCIHKNTDDVLMNYEKFIKTNTYKFLLTQWKKD